MKLRPYQSEAITNLRQSIGRGNKRPLLQCPTGGGKTNIAVEVVRSAVDRGSYVLILAPRRELICQFSERLTAAGIDHGIIMAGEPRDIWSKVQVASFDTLYARGIRDEKMFLPRADVVIVDEAHLSIAPTRKQVLNHYSGAVIIGLTATPARGDGRGLGELYDDLVESWSIRKLTDAGYLVPVRYFAPGMPDLEGLKLNRDGDYVAKQLEGRVDKPQIVGDVVSNWFRLAKDIKTVVFCVTCSHSRHVRDEFVRHGVRAEHLDGETPLDERRAILARVVSGEAQVLCNVFVASYGLDIPTLECAVLARPTRNITLYLQTVGRVLRTSPGKTEALVIDHAGAVDEHGFVDELIPWTLDSKESVKAQKIKIQQERGDPKEITCGDCGCVFKRSRSCPECGAELIQKGKPIPVHQADLHELRKDKTRKNRIDTWDQKAAFFAQLKMHCIDRNINLGWAAHKYKSRYGVWPNDQRLKSIPAIPVTPEVSSWITSQNIRFAKAKEHAA